MKCVIRMVFQSKENRIGCLIHGIVKIVSFDGEKPDTVFLPYPKCKTTLHKDYKQ